ncbi:NAD(P)/FAD-dependent oxidoreductase [Acidobacterium sp. S8]|uniref:NAD(P)/FAD-dependent oxidoreductase n=1 Tax=Acidobacterium sp. S8 TaxID=1641854 RepID=UPI00131AE0CC|nr:tryptophan 7-halogenase [Acidobacterium sp. S8]
MQTDLGRQDVIVIGGGLAGMAASIHLAKAGLKVACIEATPENNVIVGESLDWSAPELLKALGLSMEHLIAEEIATYKRHIILDIGDGCRQEYVPSEWLGNSPWNVELRTLHVDRVRLKKALREILLAHDVDTFRDKVFEVERDGKRIIALKTESGKRFDSRWFIDASGCVTSLLPRLFNLPVREYGPSKVAVWNYFHVADSIEGTTLYADGNQPGYMEWVWEIPIQPKLISVGYICTGAAMKGMRQQKRTVSEIYTQRLSEIPRFASVLSSAIGLSPQVTSFRCRVHGKIAGPNWLVVGEAAAMVDPMTSNGVTAALRSASEASSLIVKYFQHGRLPLFARTSYSRRVQELAKFFNSGIERVIYDSPIRKRIGVVNAGDVYTVPAWSMNALYARLQPVGLISTGLFTLALASLRAAACIFYWLCRSMPSAESAS